MLFCRCCILGGEGRGGSGIFLAGGLGFSVCPSLFIIAAVGDLQWGRRGVHTRK